MALVTQPFNPLSTTVILPSGGTTQTTTFASSVLGFPTARLVNNGTAHAFIQFIGTSNTTTVGVTNAVPILANSAALLSTGLTQAMAYVAAATTTIFLTLGSSGTAI